MSIGERSSGFPHIIELTSERLTRNERLRRNLPGGGRLRIDRQLPFLCVYRTSDELADMGTVQLVTTEACYLIAKDASEHHEDISQLIKTIADMLLEHFGVFLLVEIWSEPPEKPEAIGPGFRILTSDPTIPEQSLGQFCLGFQKIKLLGQSADVQSVRVAGLHPPGLPAFETSRWNLGPGFFHFGIAVRSTFRSSTDDTIYPLVLQTLRRQFANALRKSIFEFTNQDSLQPTEHFQSLGPSHLVRATREVDRELVAISESFDFLLQVTPLNATQAWDDFAESGFTETPVWHYRPLPYHPSLLKRRLYELPLEHVEDATLAQLFWEKQTELDRKISGLRNIGTPQFLYDSLHQYRAPSQDLIALSEGILKAEPDTLDRADDEWITIQDIIQAAEDQYAFYRSHLPDFDARVQVSSGIASGLLVSRDCLHISESVKLRRSRLIPLLNHEIGTHLLTYFNGRQQQLLQLSAGLANYESLQEGLAVLAEFLSGGLTLNRMRTLAGRVVGVNMLINGADFQQTFHALRSDYGFPDQIAFRITVRIYRGGGLTKDAIYLRGLRDVLSYLAKGHDLEPLYVGKMALEHIPYIRQLRRSGILRPPAVLPSLWNTPGFHDRLEACRGYTIADLVKGTV